MNNKSFFVIVLQLVQTALSAVTVIYLARLLVAEEYGKYVYYNTLASILPLFAGLGGEHVFLMEGSTKSKLIPFLFGNAILIRVVLTIAISLIAALVLFVQHISQSSAILFIIMGSLLSVFSNPLFLSFYRVKGIHIRPWIICFLAPLFFILFLLAIPFSLVSFSMASIGYFLSQCVPLCIFLLDIRGRVRLKISWKYMKSFFNKGLVFSTSQIFDYAFARLDIFLIQFIAGSYSVGIYAAGQRVVSLLQLIPSSFHVVELPEFHRLSNNIEQLTNKFRKLRLILFELGLLFFGLLAINSKQIITILFPAQYSPASTIIILLSIAGILLFINYPYYMLAEAVNKISERMMRRIYTFIITIILVYIFIKFYGINGAAIGLILGQLIFTSLLHQLTLDSNGGLGNLFYDLRSGLIALFTMFIANAVRSYLPEGFLQIIGVSIIYISLFIGLGIHFKVLTSIESLMKQITLSDIF